MCSVGIWSWCVVERCSRVYMYYQSTTIHQILNWIKKSWWWLNSFSGQEVGGGRISFDSWKALNALRDKSAVHEDGRVESTRFIQLLLGTWCFYPTWCWRRLGPPTTEILSLSSGLGFKWTGPDWEIYFPEFCISIRYSDSFWVYLFFYESILAIEKLFWVFFKRWRPGRNKQE